MTFALREYQARGVEELRAAFRRKRRSVLYVLPTGGGKTVVFAHIAQSAVALGKRVTILVHRQELLLQASAALTRLGIQHGLLSPRFTQTRDPVQIASVQTLVRRFDTVPAPDLIVIDEAHHSLASSYRAVRDRYPNAMRLGVTATPCRTNGDGLDAEFEELILGPSISELIAGGHLVPPTVYAPPVGIDLDGVRKLKGDYDKQQLQDRIDRARITGCAVDHYLRLSKGEPAIAFCVSVLHAESVARQFREAGVKAQRVDGAMDDHDRRRAIESLRDGGIDVLTSAELISEGTDIPRANTAILLRPTYSLALYLQQVGRVLRPYPGKSRALILDHVGNVMRHGFPDDDREWTLEGTRSVRKQAADPNEVRIAQCPTCYHVYEHGPQTCPRCGHAAPPRPRTIAEQEGELEELKREELAKKKAARQEVGRAKSLEELVAIGRARNYANPRFWAEQIYGARSRKVRA